MEEILELKELIQKRDYEGALRIVEELEEMSRDDIINKIESYAIVLMIHLIKQQVQNRSTKSWDVSINNSIRWIVRLNKRRRAGGYYLSDGELLAALSEVYVDAVEGAAVEIHRGIYDTSKLLEMLEDVNIPIRALELIIEKDIEKSGK